MKIVRIIQVEDKYSAMTLTWDTTKLREIVSFIGYSVVNKPKEDLIVLLEDKTWKSLKLYEIYYQEDKRELRLLEDCEGQDFINLTRMTSEDVRDLYKAFTSP